MQQGARARLRQFRQASIIAVATTGLLLLVFDPEGAGLAQDTAAPGAAVQDSAAQDTAAPDSGFAVGELPDTVAIIQQIPLEELRQAAAPEEKVRPDSLSRESAKEATGALRDLWNGFLGNLPKYAIALGVLLAAWILVRVLRPLLRRALSRWERADATSALVGFVIWLVALGIALSVLVGDIRALVGSLGLVGLALSWALQTPIESFTGWLLNSFQGYYRIGDRIAVGDVFGDVHQIDFLNTTVWEYGGADHPPGAIQAEQPTGRLITFPNNQVLTGSVINYTRDFPYVWDELAVGMAPESDVSYSVQVLERIAREVIGAQMEEPARQYEAILRRSGLEMSIPDTPQVFVSLGDASWVDYTIRYLVGARERRKWKSALSARVLEEMNRPEHEGRILPVYPRQQIQFIQPDGTPVGVEQVGGEAGRGGAR